MLKQSWLVPGLLLTGVWAAARGGLPAPDADDGGLTLPPGFRALVVADKLGRLRFMSVATNGDTYLKNQRNGLTALRDTGGTTIRYVYEVAIGGKVASIGGRLLDGAARVIIGQFFAALAQKAGGGAADQSSSSLRARIRRWFGGSR